MEQTGTSSTGQPQYGLVNQGGVDVTVWTKGSFAGHPHRRLHGYLSSYVYRLVFNDNYSQAISSEVSSNVVFTHNQNGRLRLCGWIVSSPLVGFAGAPFTLAAYTIEGGTSRDYQLAKALMYTDTGAWDALMGRLARAVTLYLNAQIDAGGSRCSSSTVGPAAWASMIIAAMSCRTLAR